MYLWSRGKRCCAYIPFLLFLLPCVTHIGFFFLFASFLVADDIWGDWEHPDGLQGIQRPGLWERHQTARNVSVATTASSFGGLWDLLSPWAEMVLDLSNPSFHNSFLVHLCLEERNLCGKKSSKAQEVLKQPGGHRCCWGLCWAAVFWQYLSAALDSLLRSALLSSRDCQALWSIQGFWFIQIKEDLAWKLWGWSWAG